jgi:N4-(beta-N-acetylglucosaminyl)-L-asparaginase
MAAIGLIDPQYLELVMSKDLSRRDFVLTGAAAGLLAAKVGPAQGQEPKQAPLVVTTNTIKPVVVSSANGNSFRNGGPKTCVEIAFQMIVDGKDVLDAVIAGVNINELDPTDSSVGYGGIPNADGVVQLDASVMHGPKKRAGAVGAIEGVRTPSLVAQKVADHTDHHLIVGKDAQAFARNFGFKIEADLNTDRSRRAWLEWKRRTDPGHYLDPNRKVDGLQAALDMAAEGWIDPEHVFGTINCNGINPKGDICGVTTTSGLSFKIPGRLGDSPILGAGLYVDNEVGAVGSTGRGESNLYSLCSFLVIECMRRGMHPKDAAMEACKRIKANSEKRLLDASGNPSQNVNFYVVNAKGEVAGVSLRPSRYAVCTENGPESRATDALITRR